MSSVTLRKDHDRAVAKAIKNLKKLHNKADPKDIKLVKDAKRAVHPNDTSREARAALKLLKCS